MSATLEHALLAAYYAVLCPLALFGLHRLALLILLWRADRRAGRPDGSPTSDHGDPGSAGDWPSVTVQLPVYNEPLVAPRLLHAVGRLDYPPEKLEIQVLDDSTDETTERLRALLENLRRRGLEVRLLHRDHRHGYKAGALEAGLAVARGDLVAVFDADFVPAADFLRRVVPSFADPSVGMVQARWGHLNRRYSLLTRLQAILLDGHFLVEHAARAATGRLFNFNGTAGVWRKRAIVEAGGWQHDTLTEDLDLSYRAQLAGWRFVFLESVVAPAELPVELAALRSQQRRWTRGSAQCLRKLLRPVLAARLPVATTVEALFHLTSNLAHPLMVALTLLLFPAIWVRHHNGDLPRTALDLAILLAATGSLLAFCASAARRAGRSRREVLALQPALMALGIGMAWHNARAALGGLVRGGGEFERTPKSCVTDDTAGPGPRRQGPEPRAPRDRSQAARRPPLGETLLALYLLACMATAIAEGIWIALPFVGLFLAGNLWIVTLAWGELAHPRETTGLARLSARAAPGCGAAADPRGRAPSEQGSPATLPRVTSSGSARAR
ncbi:MAG TPA: cellulose synthase family protein [Thermoanaerobaculia bacterium]|nr:cellulose synthase family protein [Thermoanaerobaculia bacterium]